jgi:hypothetical protein
MFALIKACVTWTGLRRVVVAILTGACLVAAAQPVGEVQFSRGVGFAQTPGQLPRTLSKGVPLLEGDRLTTAEGSAAIIKLQDGTRMTLRPNSELIVQQYRFKEESEDNSFVMQLLRGGFRAVTGSISKSSPDAARIQTANASIGIHGTDFDARLCAQDCKAEASKVTEKPIPNTVQASAKLISVQGVITATDSSGTKRKLVEGASVYQGELVETGPVTKGVLIFRDDSRLTLGASTRFKVDGFVFDDKNPTEGRFLVSLLRGSMRALTGLIGKANNRNVGFTTDTATIGIRGTGLDLDCATAEEAVSAGDAAGCSFFTWLGIIEVTPVGQTASRVLEAGQGLFVSRTVVRPLTTPTLERLQRPDSVPVDVKQLFSTGGVTVNDEGLFVYVRDGNIEVTSASQSLQLGRGETGFAGNDGRIGRPVDTPLFIQFDKVPLPNSRNPMLLSVVSETSKLPINQCR